MNVEFDVECCERIFLDHHCLACACLSLLRIISIRGNKREGRMTLQSESMIANVTWRWFFKSHTHRSCIFWKNNFFKKIQNLTKKIFTPPPAAIPRNFVDNLNMSGGGLLHSSTYFKTIMWISFPNFLKSQKEVWKSAKNSYFSHIFTPPLPKYTHFKPICTAREHGWMYHHYF